MNMPDTLGIARSALARAVKLLTVLDREHNHAELYSNLRGVRHELATLQEALRDVEPAAGPNPATVWPVGLQPPTWAARRAFATKPDTHRHRALREMVRAPLGTTDAELAEALSLPMHVARQLRWEMAAARWVTRTQQTRVNPRTGRKCTVWLGSELGRERLGKLESGQMRLPVDTP